MSGFRDWFRRVGTPALGDKSWHARSQSGDVTMEDSTSNNSEIKIHSERTPDNEAKALAPLAIQCALSIAEVAAELAPVPYIGPLVKYLTAVFQAVERSKANKEQWKLLQGRCVMVLRIAGAQVTNHGHEHYPRINEASGMLENTLIKIQRQAQQYSEMNEVEAFFKHQLISDEIEGLFSELDECLRMFSYAADVAQAQWVGEFRAVQEQEARDIRQLTNELEKRGVRMKGVDLKGDHILGRVGDSKKIADASEKMLVNKSSSFGLQGDHIPENVEAQAISKRMLVSEIVLHLVSHGCQDLTENVDSAMFGELPVSHGGFSDVYRGRLSNNMDVAIKVLRITASGMADDPKHLKHAARELHTWSKCNHPNVLQLSGLAVFRGRIGMVSPWMDNGSLPRYLERAPYVNRRDLCVQISDGLSYLHQSGIVHGDLKGANVLVSKYGTPVLTDFGNSFHMNQSLRFTRTTTGKSLTVQWTAPELIMEVGEVSEAADVYALGMTIYEVITGTIPYQGKREHTVIYLVVTQKEPPQRPDSIPAGYPYGDRLWDLLTSCWSFEPEPRPSASVVASTLRTINGYVGEQEQSPTTTVNDYVDAQQIVRIILTITKLQLPAKLLLGRQCILESKVPIKTGITCDIYLASFLGGEKVAKKVFRLGISEKEYVEKYAVRFLRIASLWCDLRSEYTLPFYGIGMEPLERTDHFQLYMVSPLMKNYDAMAYLKQYRRNAGMKKNILRIITDAARGLQYLHDCHPPVVHSGMRGDNVLITDSGGAILGGFGLTKALESEENSELPPAVMTGKTESLRWMAPEMFDDEPVLKTPCDVWGWAMTTLEIISGSIPYYKHEQVMTVILKVTRGAPPKREDHPDFDTYAHRPNEMWELLLECWNMEPEKRPVMDEVLLKLKKIAKMPEESG